MKSKFELHHVRPLSTPGFADPEHASSKKESDPTNNVHLLVRRYLERHASITARLVEERTDGTSPLAHISPAISTRSLETDGRESNDLYAVEECRRRSRINGGFKRK